jgi:hypothetical protein
MMEIKPTKRYPVTESLKYLKDRWQMDRSPRGSSVHRRDVPSLDLPGDSNFLNPMAGINVARSLSCSQLMPPQQKVQEWMLKNKSKDDTDAATTRFLHP